MSQAEFRKLFQENTDDRVSRSRCYGSRPHTLSRVHWRWILGACLLLSLRVFSAVPGALDPNLKVSFSSKDGKIIDQTTRPNVWLFVEAGKPATSFLPQGPFAAEWDGFVSLDLRAEYTFHARFNGDLRLVLNGSVILSTNSNGAVALLSRPIRLNKGTNSFRASYQSPAAGDSWLRVEWAAKDGLPIAIPLGALTHMPDSALEHSRKIREGRELVIQHRCLKCHSGRAVAEEIPHLDAPSLDGIGSRRNYQWMVKWILNPKAQRPQARMPRIFHGPEAEKDARAVAAFLTTLKEGAAEPQVAASNGSETGKELFEKLHCAACHTEPEVTQLDPDRISLRSIREKFAQGSLPGFLKSPEANYAWIQMPNFRFSDDEANQLSAYLEANLEMPVRDEAAQEAAGVERGRTLVQSTGCLKCHPSRLQNQFSVKTFASLSSGPWRTGCLANRDARGSSAPRFSFSQSELEALQEFAAADRNSVEQFDPVEFAQRELRILNCNGCHGKVEGLPKVEILGGKLKPEWSESFLAGEVRYKPRPWLESRMPAFKAYAKPLAKGMAMLHGQPAETPGEPKIESEAVEIGQKLVSAAGGFSCIACHGVGDMAATQVFESAGINLAYSAERLLKSYYQHWVLNPLSIDPTTKMPVYFDEKGRSPLSEFYDGDGIRQVNAIWEYLRLGAKMPLPPTQ